MDDVQTLLKTGSFKTSRSRSPNPYDLPVREPRYYAPDERVPRTSNQGLRIKRPPCPTVEDEESALAKEHGSDSVVSPSSQDEEPKYRGDVDQYPLLLPVFEHNPERRFVIVGGAEGGSDDGRGSYSSDVDRDSAQAPTTKSKYDANTGRKKVPASFSDEDRKDRKDSNKRPELSKRKSHQDLPPLKTRLESEFQRQEPPISRSNSRRNREKVVVSQDSRDYSDRSDNSRVPQDDGFLSPVIKHSTSGRDRPYWDSSSATNGGLQRRRSQRTESSRQPDERRSSSTQSSRPVLHRRAASNAERPNTSLNSLVQEYKYSDEDEALAFMLQGDDSPARRNPKGVRTSNSPPYPAPERDRRPSRSPSFAGERPSFRDQGEYYDDDSVRYQKSDRSDRPRPRRTTLERDSNSLLSPDQPWAPSSSRSKSKAGSPLPSPRATQGGQFPDLPSPRSPRSATFPPTERDSKRYERSISPSAPLGESPPRRTDGATRSRADSHASTINNPFSSSSASMALPIPFPGGRSDFSERRPSPGPPASPSFSRQESLDQSTPQSYWQPEPFDPSKQNALLDMPITSYRRYSEDVQKGLLPSLPECAWKVPGQLRRASDGAFLTLPRTSFDICSDCHGSAFGNTHFSHMFVPAIVRPEQLISCDFGSSPWYRIAYLMTLKYAYPDLRLLKGIASVAARQQPCAGAQFADRIWYSMKDPTTQRPIRSFKVCSSCAEMVQVLLPNLAGVFVPLDSASEPTRGVCELHFAPDRKRFTEYFDLMERTSDKALSRRVAPNIQDLADRIVDISMYDECHGGRPVMNRKWHVMEDIGDFTVCQECFTEVVRPLLKDERRSSVPRAFFKARQQRPFFTICQLHSERMRDVFRRACRKDDMDYLEARSMDRVRRERPFRMRYKELQEEDQDDLRVQMELMALVRQLNELD
ncbi:hypothetical protein B0H66DRAFT_599989 [Apodospora peruviana]|uniref:Uncharacterized protein n=1 Tax=Apodospora peruviana TaxID=516989 RepID=A0AAE0IIS0_9PEZI|nr:hypothetical protein B0H66DRAFT_599989 [Apodospora peruviana]